MTGLAIGMDPAARVSGTLRLPDGSPVTSATNARIRPFDDSGVPVSTEPAIPAFFDQGDGTFVTELPPGQWFLLFENNNPALALIDTALGQQPCPRGSCGMTTTQSLDIAQGADVTGLEVQLMQGVPITGTVFDEDVGAGTPVEFGVVLFYDQDNDYAGFAPVSSQDGSFTSAAGFPPGDWFASTIFEFNGPPFSQVPPDFIDELYDNLPCQNGCDYSAGDPIVVTDQPPAPITIGLTRGASLGGNVQGVQGVLQGVEVQLFDGPGSMVASAFTDADGNYLIEGLLPGTYFAVTENAQGLEDRLYDGFSCEPFCNPDSGMPIDVAVGDSVIGIDFILPGAASLAGRVSDEFDAPLVDVQVEVYNALGELRSTTATDGDGNWSVGSLAAGTFFVRTRNGLGLVDRAFDGLDCLGCDVTRTTPLELDQAEQRTGVDLQLVAGSMISGNVVSAANGDPVAGVNVEVFSASGSLVGASRSDSGGQWRVDGLAPGDYFVATRSSVGFVDQLHSGLVCEPGCVPADGTAVTLTAGSPETLNLSLQEAGAIRGTVRDVSANLLGGIVVRAVDDQGRTIREATTGADGRYRIGGLPAGDVFLRTRAQGGFTDQTFQGFDCIPLCDVLNGVPVEVASGAVAEGIDFDLTPGGGITGHITDGAADPLGALEVDIFNHLGSTVASVITDAVGEYLVRGLPEGRYFVRTRNTRGFIDRLFDGIDCTPGPCTVGTGTPVDLGGGIAGGVDFSLQPGSELSGTATDQFGNPLPGGEVVLFDSLGREVKRAGISGGNWSLTGLADGSYFLVILNGSRLVDELFDDIPCPGAGCDVTQGTSLTVGAAPATVAQKDGNRGSVKATVSVSDGPLDISLEPGSLIRGRVNGPDGAGIAGAEVTFFNDSGEVVGSAVANGVGEYESESAFSAGTYFAATSDGEQRGVGGGLVNALFEGADCPLECDPTTSGTEIGLAAEVDRDNIDFALAAGGGLTGITVDDLSNPLPGATIEVFDDQGRLAGTATVDSLGNWMVDGLPNGEYAVVLRTDLLSEFTDFVIGAGRCSGDCDPAAGATFTVSAGSEGDVDPIELIPEAIIFRSDFE